MELTKVEWSKAQDLLIKLVQVLSPLTDQTNTNSFVLTGRFFIPSMNHQNLDRFQRPASIITTLHSVQKQVEEMIIETVAAEPAEEDRKKTTPIFERVLEPSKLKAPLTIQAQKLIEEVQEAIGKLCTSTQIQDPKGAPLREALKRLKPNLDRIVEAVVSEEKEFHTQLESTSIRPTRTPILARERLPSRQIVFSEALKTEDKSLPSSEKEKMIPRGVVAKPILSKVEEKSLPAPKLEEKQVFKQQEASHTTLARPTERTSLPVAPFVPLMRQLTSALSKKKKRKGFWFREEEERDK